MRQHLDHLQIPYIFCPPYSPDFNGIESVFSIYKNKLKRDRLKAIVKGEHIDLVTKTREIFDEIKKDKIIACINFSLNKLFNHTFWSILFIHFFILSSKNSWFNFVSFFCSIFCLILFFWWRLISICRLTFLPLDCSKNVGYIILLSCLLLRGDLALLLQ